MIKYIQNYWGRITRNSTRLLVLGTLASVLCTSCTVTSNPRSLGLYIFPDGAADITRMARACAQQAQGEYTFDIHVLPRSANDQRLQLARRLTAHDASMDILATDIIWTAEFARAQWIQPLTADWLTQQNAHTLAGPLRTSMWNNRQYSVPFFANTPLLWYRKDLVHKYLNDTVPSTWQGLIRAAQILKKHHQAHYITFLGKQYEGLFVFFNSLLESAGGSFLAPDNTTVTLIDTPQHREATRQALHQLHTLATFPGQDPAINQADEAYGRLTMENNHAAFEINWSFVFASMRANSVAGAVPFLRELTGKPARTAPQIEALNRHILTTFSYAPFPVIASSSSSIHVRQAQPTLGGTNLALSRYSHKNSLAYRALQCLTSTHAQKTYTIGTGIPPTDTRLYQDRDIHRLLPPLPQIRNQLTHASIRPLTPQYQAVSTLVTAYLSPITGKEPTPEQLDHVVRKGLEGKGLVP